MDGIEPYMAVGLSPTVWGVRERSEIQKNLDHIHDALSAACWLSTLELPVKLVIIPEGGLQGFTDEIMDMDMQEYIDSIAIEIPGPETEVLSEYAREFDVFLAASAKEPAVDPEMDGLFYNTAFLLNPDGEMILKHRKLTPLLPTERSVSPHDVWDRWTQHHGSDLDSFFHVADTDIGRISICLAIEGAYPEYVRGFAMNGAEVICRIACPKPLTSSGMWEIQNRARAVDNTLYMVCPNLGEYFLHQDVDKAVDVPGGKSQIINYRGKILDSHDYGAGTSFCSAPIDIESLRYYRTHSPLTNWIKDLRTELIQTIYKKEIYPKNLWLEQTPYHHDQYAEEVTEGQIQKMIDRDIFRPSMLDGERS